jgi:hypothetical protein
MREYNPNPLKKFTLLFFIALILTLGLVSAQDSEESSSTTLKVIQLSPDAESMDIFVDDEKVGEDLEFGDLVGLELESGRHTIRAVSETADVSTNVNLNQDRSYMLTINNRIVNPETTLISQDLSDPQDQAKVRTAHFSPDLLEVNIDARNGNSFTARDLSYRETSRYTTVSPGNYTIKVTEARVGGIEFNRRVRLRAGRTYTLFVSGLKSTRVTGQDLRIIPVSGNMNEKIDDEDNGDVDGDQTGNGDGIEKDFRLVCRLEETD